MSATASEFGYLFELTLQSLYQKFDGLSRNGIISFEIPLWGAIGRIRAVGLVRNVIRLHNRH